MSKTDLHIISFNIPYPANYGGIIDVFYKLKNLSETGMKIHLHCFQYGREQQEILKKYAYKVSYYKRPKLFFYHFSSKPYIVRSRQNSELLKSLLQDNAPILFEGLHTCAYLSHKDLSKRFKIVRTHNIEHTYYNELSKRTANFIKKIYYKIDALKLKSFEKILKHADALVSISNTDFEYFNNNYGNAVFIPPFHSSNVCTLNNGRGDYALFQGNLSVPENYQMAFWIIENIFSKIDISLTIAGFNPDKSIVNAASKYANIKVISNPSDDEMRKLIFNAHLNLLFTLQPTGLKLKLLNALFNGRFCLCNKQMLEGTGIEKSVNIVDINDKAGCINLIQNLFKQEFNETDIQIRENEVNELYDNKVNTKLLLDVIQNIK